LRVTAKATQARAKWQSFLRYVYVFGLQELYLSLIWFMHFGCDILEERRQKQRRNKTFSLPWFSLPSPFISLSILRVSAKGLARRVDVAIHQNVIMHKSAYPIPFIILCVYVYVCDGWCFKPQLAYTWNHMKNVMQRKRRTDQ